MRNTSVINRNRTTLPFILISQDSSREKIKSTTGSQNHVVQSWGVSAAKAIQLLHPKIFSGRWPGLPTRLWEQFDLLRRTCRPSHILSLQVCLCQAWIKIWVKITYRSGSVCGAKSDRGSCWPCWGRAMSA